MTVLDTGLNAVTTKVAKTKQLILTSAIGLALVGQFLCGISAGAHDSFGNQPLPDLTMKYPIGRVVNDSGSAKVVYEIIDQPNLIIRVPHRAAVMAAEWPLLDQLAAAGVPTVLTIARGTYQLPGSVDVRSDPCWVDVQKCYAAGVKDEQKWQQAVAKYKTQKTYCDLNRIARTLSSHNFYVYDFQVLMDYDGSLVVHDPLAILVTNPDNEAHFSKLRTDQLDMLDRSLSRNGTISGYHKPTITISKPHRWRHIR